MTAAYDFGVRREWLDARAPSLAAIAESEIVIGIDIGVDGGIGVIRRGDGSLVDVAKTPLLADGKNPDVEALMAWAAAIGAKRNGTVNIGIERVGAGPGEGARAMFTFGMHNAAAHAFALAVPGRKITEVLPEAWQKPMLRGLPTGKQTKRSSLRRAAQLFPGAPADFTVLKNSGMSDALLIAEYLRRWINRYDS